MAILIDPDYYTKVRLDQNGNILDASWLEPEDLPDHTHSLDEITGDFQSKVISCLRTFFANSKDNAVVFTFDEATKTLSADVRIDDFSITRNELGELQSERGGEGGGSSVSTECATHTHTSDQIDDFEEAVKHIINTQVSKVDINDLSKLIDNTTIVINSKGQLSAVGTAVAEHTHYLKDIVDYVAPQAAVFQAMSDLGDGVDYTGVVDLTHLSIGHSIVALNYYIDNVVNKRIDLLSNQISKIAMTSSNANALSTFKVDPSSMHNTLTEVSTGRAKDVYYANNLKLLLEALPYDDCYIVLEIDGEDYFTADAADLSAKGMASGPFKVYDTVDKGIASDMILQVSLPELSEGEHSFRLRYELGDGVVDYSEKLKLNITNVLEMEFEVKDLNPTHTILNETYYDAPYEGLWGIRIKNFNNLKYVNFESGFDVSGYLRIEEDEFGSKVIENLFGTTPVAYAPEYEVEESSSDVYKNLIDSSVFVINDTITNGSVIFEVPGSQRFNTILINGLKGDEYVKIIKGGSGADTDQVYEPFVSSGKVSNVNGVMLTLAEDYDDGVSTIDVQIETKSPLNLKKISWELLNL